MSAAHELAERGFEVVVYEQRAVAGGKARSVDAIPGTGGRRGAPRRARLPLLPRLLPAPARHHAAASPIAGQLNGVLDNLVTSTQVQVAREDAPHEIIAPAHFPLSSTTWEARCASASTSPPTSGSRSRTRRTSWGCSRLLPAARSGASTSTRTQSWWEFSDAERRSAAYQKFLCRRPDPLAGGRAGPRDERAHRRQHPAPAAARPRHARAARPTGCSTAPPTTSGSTRGWPSCARLGVDYRFGSRCTPSTQPERAREPRRQRVADGEPVGWTDTADYYVAAVPVEVMRDPRDG